MGAIDVPSVTELWPTFLTVLQGPEDLSFPKLNSQATPDLHFNNTTQSQSLADTDFVVAALWPILPGFNQVNYFSFS